MTMILFYYLGVFSQHCSVRIINGDQLFQDLILMLLTDGVLCVDSAAQISG